MTASPDDSPGRAQLEQTLTQLWMDTLQLSAVGPADSFFALGGDSLSAKRMLMQVRRRVGVECSLNDFFDADTIASLCDLIGRTLAGPAASIPEIEEGTI